MKKTLLALFTAASLNNVNHIFSMDTQLHPVSSTEDPENSSMAPVINPETATLNQAVALLVQNQQRIIQLLESRGGEELTPAPTHFQRFRNYLFHDSYIGTVWCCSSTADLIVSILGVLAFAGVITLKN